MRNLSILSIVLVLFGLQSCSDSNADISVNPVSIEANSTQSSNVLPISDLYTDLAIDTTLDEANVFINRVDDETAYAYGRLYQSNGAELTCYSITVPYSCIRYDYDTQKYYIQLKKFRKLILTDAYAQIYIESKSLIGYSSN